MTQERGAEKSEGASLESLLAQWRRERPDLDPRPMATCGAVWRAAERLKQGIAENIKSADLDYAGFDVLMTLRRQGSDGAGTPSALAAEMMLSTSAMTNRLDRLERRGLITRQADPNDRRSTRIVLTDEGFALADRLAGPHLEAEERMLAALTQDERELLRTLLEKIAR